MGSGGRGGRERCAGLLLLCWLCCWPDHDESRSRSGAGAGRRHPPSAASLHLPGPSGHAKPPSHRSHEEIRSREAPSETRYHSAPSVIHEVLHRRDWQRSARDLHIPLQASAPAPCKKHHSNIKSSKTKEATRHDVKDTDATEACSFYIGDDAMPDNTRVLRGKGAKQTANESIRMAEGAGDRSGAVHHTIESRVSFSRPYPPPSVEAVDYSGGACYLASAGPPAAPFGAGRARHASDGDILAPAHRPESGAFSESDLDLELELEAREERPPPYHELQLYPPTDRKETAI